MGVPATTIGRTSVSSLNLPTGTGWQFLRDRHLATCTTLLRDGSPHVVPVGFTIDEDLLVQILTRDTSQKIANLRRDPRIVICQVEGRNWISIHGRAEVRTAGDEVTRAEHRYAQRYHRTPTPNEHRVVAQFKVHRLLGSRDVLYRQPPDHPV